MILRTRYAFALFAVCLLLTLAACDGNISDNPLGYTFVGKTLHNSDQKHTPTLSAPSQAKSLAHLRPYGIGLPPETFITQYGAPLSPSQPPTQLWFKATSDTFPAGSVMIVGFDRSSEDNAPRANELSYVAGDSHPTTITQAETIAESFLPNDTQGPVLIHSYDAKANTCQSATFTSASLATLFPPQDFLDGSGKIAKGGTVTISFFPYYSRSSLTTQNYPYPNDVHADGDAPTQTDAISSFLLTLGTKPYC